MPVRCGLRLELADRVTLTPAAWIEQIAIAMTGHRQPGRHRGLARLNRFDGTDRELRVLDHVGRPAPGQQIRVTGPAGTSTDYYRRNRHAAVAIRRRPAALAVRAARARPLRAITGRRG